MARRNLTRTLLTLVCLGAPCLEAAPPAKEAMPGPFKLGEVTVPVTASLEAMDTVNTKVDAEQLQTFNTATVASALDLLPGLSLTLNSRNEQMLYIRGNDSR